MAESMNGGCQCGAVRYQAADKPMLVALCHCTMCRRAHGASMVAWAMYSIDAVKFTGKQPKVFHSSAAQRGFCAQCGTHISFIGANLPGMIDLTVGSFDHPEVLTPNLHYWDAKRLPWLKFADDLPRHAEFPPFE